MKKTMIALGGILLTALPLAAVAATESVGGILWQYEVSGGTAVIRKSAYSPAIPQTTAGAITVPSTLGGYRVTEIGNSAFYGCTNLTSVTVPSGVMAIGEDSFWRCSKLAEVNLPNSVTAIGDYAFSDCGGLTRVTIPNSVTAIGSSAFSGCSGLTRVTIPNSVTVIGSFAFSGCSGLTGVTIGDGVTSIGCSTFWGCSALTSVTIGDGVASIEDGAFSGCSLTSVTIPSSVERIGDSAFLNCTNLAEISVASDNLSYSSRDGILYDKFGKVLIQCPERLSRVTIPESVTNIGNYAFCGCGGLTSVTIPNSVTAIGDYAFSDCGGLTSVTLPDGVARIGNGAFSSCGGLTDMTIPDSVVSVGSDAFCGCTNLTSLAVLGDADIGGGVFRGCANLREITVPDMSTHLGVLFGSGNVKHGFVQVLVYDGQRSYPIGEYLIPSALRSVTLTRCTELAERAFYGCSMLERIVLPSTLTNMAANAFVRCTGLLSVEVEDGNPRYSVRGGVLFDDVRHSVVLVFGAETVIIPAGTSAVEDGAFLSEKIKTMRVETPDVTEALADVSADRWEVHPYSYGWFAANKPGTEVVATAIDGLTLGDCMAAKGIGIALDLDKTIVAESALQATLRFSFASASDAFPPSETHFAVFGVTRGGEETKLAHFTAAGEAIANGAFVPLVVEGLDVAAYSGYKVSVSNALFAGAWESGRIGVPSKTSVVAEIYSGDSYSLYATSTTGVLRVHYDDMYSATPANFPGRLELAMSGDYNSYTGGIDYEYVTYILPEGSPGYMYASIPTMEYRYGDNGWCWYYSTGKYINDTDVNLMLRYPQSYPCRFYFYDQNGYRCGGTATLEVPPYIKTHTIRLTAGTGLTLQGFGYGPYGEVGTSADDGSYDWAWCFGSSIYYYDDDSGRRSISLPSSWYGAGHLEVAAGYYLGKVASGGAYVRYDQDGNAMETSSGSIYSYAFGPVTSDCEFSFEASLVRYAINFVDELGAENPNATSYTVEDSFEFATPGAVDGWDFLGWDVSGVHYQTGDITVTAQWSRSTRTVTFDIGAHGVRTGGGALEQTVAWGEAVEAPKVEANTGWTFAGWDADLSRVTESGTIRALYTRAPLSVEEATGLDKAWTSGGGAPWFAEWSEDAHDGVACMRSGAIGDDAESWLETVVTNSGVVSFWWKVSSEIDKKGTIFDKAFFTVDGAIPAGVPEIGGETDWSNVTFRIEGDGPHVLRWTYAKDRSSAGGADCAWLDDVRYLREVRVSFDAGGAEGDAPEAIVVGEGEEVVLPSAGTLAMPKHRFAGWRAGDALLDAASVYATSCDDVVFTAEWERKVVSAPSIDVAAWYDTETTLVRMTCGTPGATIRYTLDGTEPTAESPRYVGAFRIAGTATIRAVAMMDDCFDSETVSAESVRAPWTPGECLNAPELEFRTGGTNAAAWARDMSVAHDGVAAMRSGATKDGGASWIEATVRGPGTLTFWWRASSEDYDNGKVIYDVARFTVDGASATADIGGETDWREVSVEISGFGAHVLRWAYVKDASDFAGDDCAWLDEVTWTPEPTADVTVDAGGGKTVTVPTAWLAEHGLAPDGDATARAANGRKIWECYVLGLDPTVAASDFRITAFPMKADGTPDVSNIVFDPPQEKWNVQDARAVIKGAATLTGPWVEVIGGLGEAALPLRFFKVEVALP